MKREKTLAGVPPSEQTVYKLLENVPMPWEQVRNVTEVGVLFGRSLPMWHGYFPNARIWGVDIQLTERVVDRDQLGAIRGL